MIELELEGQLNPTHEINRAILKSEVNEAIWKSTNGKSPGIDFMVYEALKNIPSINALASLFTKCLELSMVPENWKKALISLIPKSASSDPGVPLNYRGISLLPVVGKLLNGVLVERISRYLETTGILTNEQV